MRRSYKGICPENITNRPIFGRINQNSATKVHKPTIQKSKIIKNWFFQKSDADDVSWSILVQELPTTPKVLIFDSKNSSHEELIQHPFAEKIAFFWLFFDFHMSRKVIFRRTQRKNYHLKVLPINSRGFLDVFCTMNEYTTTLRSKNTSCQSTLILLENLHTHHIIQNSIISKQNERTLTGCIFWYARRCIFVHDAKHI